jgi:DNA-binding NarL/FixJ family response regulator
MARSTGVLKSPASGFSIVENGPSILYDIRSAAALEWSVRELLCNVVERAGVRQAERTMVALIQEVQIAALRQRLASPRSAVHRRVSRRSPNAIMTRKYKILIVDDHPLIRRGLSDLINRQADLEVCGEAADADEAIRLVDSSSPDVAVIDMSLKSGHGLDLIGQIRLKNDRVRMLVSSMHDELLFAERSLRAGAMGYVPKQEPAEKLLDAIRHVLRGQVYLTPRMSNRLLHCMVGGAPSGENPVAGLSDRELEVFEMIGQGMTTQQIAHSLQLSDKTIETHREKIKHKLNLKNSAELGRAAVQWVMENA